MPAGPSHFYNYNSLWVNRGSLFNWAQILNSGLWYLREDSRYFIFNVHMRVQTLKRKLSRTLNLLDISRVY